MSKILILYFSGTGNTERLAEYYQEALKEKGDEVLIMKMEDYQRDASMIDWHSIEKLGIGYPIHAFNAPRIVHEVVKQMPKGKNIPTFIFCASGGYSPTNDGAMFIIREKLLRKGFLVFYEAMFLTATNFLTRTDEHDIRKLFQVAKYKIQRYAEEIHTNQKRLKQVPEWNRIFSRIMLMEHFGSKMMGKYHFYANEDCYLCKKCIEACPMGNIRNEGGYIKFGFRCLMCMRCLYACPVNAIRVKMFSLIASKGGFDLNKVLSETNNDDVLLKDVNDPFYKKNRKYIEEL
ncbi:MAG TPA: EFR1 family ferrodoxin [Candidatus Cloacimonadota bacterium]|nr:EFR1 family ferrodoxin [Candidatus Cloacimonadota bacterium]HPT72284.1 EFR1 family ferrodoxin [Candidatus Cloacimonadota bacterium]